MSSPNFVVPLKNSTLVTVPSVSAAFAARLIVAGDVNTEPLVGEVRATVGSTKITTGALITIFTTAEVVVAPALSVALAVIA